MTFSQVFQSFVRIWLFQEEERLCGILYSQILNKTYSKHVSYFSINLQEADWTHSRNRLVASD